MNHKGLWFQLKFDVLQASLFLMETNNSSNMTLKASRLELLHVLYFYCSCERKTYIDEVDKHGGLFSVIANAFIMLIVRIIFMFCHYMYIHMNLSKWKSEYPNLNFDLVYRYRCLFLRVQNQCTFRDAVKRFRIK